MTNQTVMQVDEETRTQITTSSAIAIWSRNLSLFSIKKSFTFDIMQNIVSGSWPEDFLNTLHVVTLDSSSKLLQMTMDENQQNVNAFWRFSVKDMKDNVWEDLKEEIYEHYDFNQTVKLMVLYDILFQYVSGQVQKPLTESSPSTSKVCEVDGPSFIKVICNFLIQSYTSGETIKFIWEGNSQLLPVRNCSLYPGYVRVAGKIVVTDKNDVEIPYVWIQDDLRKDSENTGCAIRCDSIPEKMAACLALAQESSNNPAEKGCNVYGIDFCGHYATFWRADFTCGYLNNILTCSKYLPADTYVLLKHSDVLDLTECNERKEFARTFLKMLDDITKSRPGLE